MVDGFHFCIKTQLPTVVHRLFRSLYVPLRVEQKGPRPGREEEGGGTMMMRSASLPRLYLLVVLGTVCSQASEAAQAPGLPVRTSAHRQQAAAPAMPASAPPLCLSMRGGGGRQKEATKFGERLVVDDCPCAACSLYSAGYYDLHFSTE